VAAPMPVDAPVTTISSLRSGRLLAYKAVSIKWV
jgi:hypothetical protein